MIFGMSLRASAKRLDNYLSSVEKGRVNVFFATVSVAKKLLKLAHGSASLHRLLPSAAVRLRNDKIP
jgi:hypothetical protein